MGEGRQRTIESPEQEMRKATEDQAGETQISQQLGSMFAIGIVVTTTNEKLAQRIRRTLKSTYQGYATYHWSEPKFLSVEWQRLERRYAISSCPPNAR